MGIFTPMKNFLLDLEAHNLQNRCFSLLENGSWSPVAGKLMKEIIDRIPNSTIEGKTVKIMSSPSEKDMNALTELAETVSKSILGGNSKPVKATEAAASTKWVCKLCGYVYEGDELPKDYKCPICGAGISAFEKVSK